MQAISTHTPLENTIRSVFSDQNKAMKIINVLKELFSNCVSAVTTTPRSNGDIKMSITLDCCHLDILGDIYRVIPQKISCVAKKNNIIDFEDKDEAPYECDTQQIYCGLITRKCTWWDLQINRDTPELTLHHDLKILNLIPIGGTPIVKSLHLKPE